MPYVSQQLYQWQLVWLESFEITLILVGDLSGLDWKENRVKNFNTELRSPSDTNKKRPRGLSESFRASKPCSCLKKLAFRFIELFISRKLWKVDMLTISKQEGNSSFKALHRKTLPLGLFKVSFDNQIPPFCFSALFEQFWYFRDILGHFRTFWVLYLKVPFKKEMIF